MKQRQTKVEDKRHALSQISTQNRSAVVLRVDGGRRGLETERSLNLQRIQDSADEEKVFLNGCDQA